VSLLYDARPEVRDRRDDGPADARPDATVQTAAAPQAVLKPWILPTGNRFLGDPAKRLLRPPGNPGEVAYVRSDFDDSSWRRVDLPHDWAIEGPFLATGPHGGMGRLPSAGVGWYRRKLTVPKADEGRSIFLDVDGAMSYASVWLNGQIVGGWPFGYASWRVDLTPYVAWGAENQLAIRLDNPPSSSRWYPGGGLYRNVWLTKTQPLHVAQWGAFVTTRDVSPAAATIDLAVTVDNDSRTQTTASVAAEIYALDAAGRRAGAVVARVGPVETSVAAAGSATVRGTARIVRPKLWGPPPQQLPNRYVAVMRVTSGGRPSDIYETTFGIR
jgi:beta-galactosidase